MLTPTVRIWMIGESLTLITLTPQTLTAGVMADGTPVDLLGEIMSVEVTTESVNQDIRPVTEPGINEYPISHGDSLRIGVLQYEGSLNKLQNAVRTTVSRRFKVAYEQEGEVITGYYTFRRWTGGITDRGQNAAVADFGPCKPEGVAQVTYVASS